jgi:hypothetical protein
MYQTSRLANAWNDAGTLLRFRDTTPLTRDAVRLLRNLTLPLVDVLAASEA